MRLNNNIAALTTYTSLLNVNKKIDKSMRNLSSGYKINSVSDDAAGFAISNKMKNQIRGLDMASRNSLDGISLVQTAEGAFTQINDIVNRIRELAVQSSNDSVEPDDRDKINEEVQQLLSELDSISQKTEFNNIKMLNGAASRVTISSDILVAKATYVSDNINSTPRGEAGLEFELISAGLPAMLTLPASYDPNTPIPEHMIGQSITINGETITYESSDTGRSFYAKFLNLVDRVGAETKTLDNGDVVLYTREQGSHIQLDISGSSRISSDTGEEVLRYYQDPNTGVRISEITTHTDTGSTTRIVWVNPNTGLEETLPVQFNEGASFTFNQDVSYTDIDGNEVTDTVTITVDIGEIQTENEKLLDFFGLSDLILPHSTPITGTDAVISNNIHPTYNDEDMYPLIVGNKIQFLNSRNDTIEVEIQLDEMDSNGDFSLKGGGNPRQPVFIYSNTTPIVTFNIASSISILPFGQLQIQIGANKNMELDLSIPKMSTKSIGLEFADVRTLQNAQRTIKMCDKAQSFVSKVQSNLGAYENRLQYTMKSLDVTSVNTSAAKSRVMDADMAWEMTILTQNNVIAQAAMSIMAQANNRPQQLLQIMG